MKELVIDHIYFRADSEIKKNSSTYKIDKNLENALSESDNVNISSEYILKDINLSINKGGSLSILGPSGCGKTTLLRIIAGLEKPYSGSILFRGKNLNNVPAYKRNFGMMFQDFALFPHRNVFKNISFGLEMKKISKKEINLRVKEMLELVNLENYAQRDIRELSGGERQRVALARTLAPSPELIMLDEPLGALDRRLRERLLDDLCFILNKSKIKNRERLRNNNSNFNKNSSYSKNNKSNLNSKDIDDIGITTIWVTHDHNEAFTVADTVCVMNKGKVEQIDTPEKLYNNPANRVVADFLGFQNIININNNISYNTNRTLSKNIDSKEEQFLSILIMPDAGVVVSENKKEVIFNKNIIAGIIINIFFQGISSKIAVKISDNSVLKINLNPQDRPYEVSLSEQILFFDIKSNVSLPKIGGQIFLKIYNEGIKIIN